MRFTLSLGLLLLLCSNAAWSNEQKCAAWIDHKLQALHSKKAVDLCALTQNRPVLLVNTASHCGFTYQFGELEKLHQKYKERGLVIVGFPSNAFNQEAQDEKKIAEVCYKNYGVNFTMTEQIQVKGPGAHPIFAHLANQKGAPKWNFNKYLISSTGEVIAKYGSSTGPLSEGFIASVENLLKPRP